MFMQGLLLTASNPLTIIFWDKVIVKEINNYPLIKVKRCRIFFRILRMNSLKKYIKNDL